jgi:hypothetical protein
VFEDEDIIIDLDAQDPEDDSLSYSYEISNGSASLDGSSLMITPDQDFNGDMTLTVTVSDGELEDSETFAINVLAVNDAPSIVSIEDTQIAEDTNFEIDLNASDIDSEELFYSVSVSGNASAYVLGNQLQVTPFPGFSGIIEITVFVSDGYLSSNTSFNLEVIPVNDPPVLSFIGSQIVNEDEDLIIDLDAQDPEDDPLSYSYEISNGLKHKDCNLNNSTKTWKWRNL